MVRVSLLHGSAAVGLLLALLVAGPAQAGEGKKKGTTVEVGGTKVKVGAGGTQVKVGDGVTVDTEGAEDEAGAAAEDAEDSAAVAVDEVTGSGKDSFVVAGNARKIAHECKPNEKVSISGNSHTVTLTGPCKSVNASGNAHTISVDTAGAITVSGNGIKLTYRAGLEGKEPKIVKSGNKVVVKKLTP